MSVGIVPATDFLEGRSKQVTNRDPLANVDVTEGVDVNAPGIAQILVRALVEPTPRRRRGAGGQLLRRATPEADGVLPGAVLLHSVCSFQGSRLGYLDHVTRNGKELGSPASMIDPSQALLFANSVGSIGGLRYPRFPGSWS